MAVPLDSQFAEVAGPLLSALASADLPARGDWESRRRMVSKLLTRLGGQLPSNSQVTRIRFEVPVDGAGIPMTWFQPPGPPRESAALFLHGGGMILGSVDLFDRMIAKYVADSDVPMLAVDYRLAPEFPYPTPLEDCYAALCWLHEHAVELGVDPGRIGLIGESAGGGLAAAVSLLARERGGPPIASQILIYPMLDDRNTDDDGTFRDVAFWTHDDNATGWHAFLGDETHGTNDVPATAAPGRCTNFAGLPPTYLEVGQADIFRDEVMRFAGGLLTAQVSTELHVIQGVPHSFEWIAPATDVAVRAMANRVRALRTL